MKHRIRVKKHNGISKTRPTRRVLTALPSYKCKYCGYGWIPRTTIPAECPNCKRRNWLSRR